MKKRAPIRLLALTLALAALMGLAACGQKTETTAAGEGENETVSESQAEPVAGVDFAPERGKADTSELLWLDAIQGYKKSDWSAQWIWTKSCSEDSYVAFRKSFSLDTEPGEVTAYISAVDKYVLWVNGELLVLDGCLKRGPTPVDSYYDTVTIPNLHKGENVIALLVAFNGRSGDGSIVPVMLDADGDEVTQAGLLFEMNAGGTLVKSDNNWRAMRHNAYKNRVSGGKEYVKYDQSSMLAERNVWYKAEDEIGSYMAADYDDSGWEQATLIANAGDLPFGELYSAITKPVKFSDIQSFAEQESAWKQSFAEDTTLELKLPGNMQFTWYVELKAPAGKKLTVYTDTYTDRDQLPNFKDTYITRDGEQSYENYPWRSGSKLILELEAGVEILDVGYRPSGFHGEWAGSFTSSDARLDQLWQESLNTIAICMRDTYMDCPERERGPYMGDASNQIDAALYSYDEGGLALTKKAILACLGWTKTDATIPSRAPSVKPQEIPNQSLSFMTSAYHYWLHSGDRETMTAYYRAFIKYLSLFEMGDNGLPLYRAGSWQWNDWGNRIDSDLLQLGFYTYALDLTIKLADDLGITEDAEFLSQRMESIRANWHDAFYTEEGFKSESSKYIDERANALLVLSGLAGEEDYELITDVIMSTFEASPYTEKYVLEALCVMGREDLAMQRMLQRYDPMLHDEWDTLWEQFNDSVGTYNHGWTAAPLYILSKYVAGVQPTAPGFESYEIVPSTALESYDCVVWTPKGQIHVVKDGGSLTVTAVSGGTLVLPDGQRTELKEGENRFEI